MTRLSRGAWSLLGVCLVLCAASTVFYAWRSATGWSPASEGARAALSHQTNATGVFAGVVVFGALAIVLGRGPSTDVALAAGLGLGGWAMEYLPFVNGIADRDDIVAGFAAAAVGLFVLTAVRLLSRSPLAPSAAASG